MLRRFSADRRGVAAIEFALLLPVLVLLYCGLAEFTLAIMAQRQAAHAASVVGDLVAQETNVNAAEMNDIFAVGQAIIKPFPRAPLKLRVTSVKADAQGVPRVVWSQGNGLGSFGLGITPAGFPPTLLAAGDSVIQADVGYTYTSPLQQVLPRPVSYANTFYLRPRRSAEVAWTGP